MPLVVLGLVVLHLLVLHEAGSSSAAGGRGLDFVFFYPYYTVKDFLSFVGFLILYSSILFFYTNDLGHTDNSIQANAVVTPPHIVPE